MPGGKRPRRGATVPPVRCRHSRGTARRSSSTTQRNCVACGDGRQRGPREGGHGLVAGQTLDARALPLAKGRAHVLDQGASSPSSTDGPAPREPPAQGGDDVRRQRGGRRRRRPAASSGFPPAKVAPARAASAKLVGGRSHVALLVLVLGAGPRRCPSAPGPEAVEDVVLVVLQGPLESSGQRRRDDGTEQLVALGPRRGRRRRPPSALVAARRSVDHRHRRRRRRRRLRRIAAGGRRWGRARTREGAARGLGARSARTPGEDALGPTPVGSDAGRRARRRACCDRSSSWLPRLRCRSPARRRGSSSAVSGTGRPAEPASSVLRPGEAA